MENEDTKKILKTFDFDKFGLTPFANQLTKYLQVESQLIDGSFVLSLNSEFGSGKSTFFEMWQDQLNTAGNIFDVVYINAWESDFQGDPLLSIVSQLLKSKPAEDDELKNSIKETAGKLGKFALSLSNDFVAKYTGLDIKSAAESGETCFKLYEEKCKLFEELKKELRSLTKKSDYPILIIVDELDRCRPTYAIEFLETIKHFFDIKGLVFVLGVDKQQLISSAKALFGQDLKFDEYYRKFAHRNTTLPVKTQPMTETFCKKLADEYLSQEAFEQKGRFSYAEHNSYRIENVVEICTAFSLNARQMHEFFRISAHVFSMSAESNSKLLWGWHVSTFFMVAISLKYHDIYKKIGTKNITLSEFTRFAKALTIFSKDNNGIWWAILSYLGIFNDADINEIEKECYELGVWDKKGFESIRTEGEVTEFITKIRGFHDAYDNWGGRYSVHDKIYNTLEELKTLEEG